MTMERPWRRYVATECGVGLWHRSKDTENSDGVAAVGDWIRSDCWKMPTMEAVIQRKIRFRRQPKRGIHRLGRIADRVGGWVRKIATRSAEAESFRWPLPPLRASTTATWRPPWPPRPMDSWTADTTILRGSSCAAVAVAPDAVAAGRWPSRKPTVANRARCGPFPLTWRQPQKRPYPFPTSRETAVKDCYACTAGDARPWCLPLNLGYSKTNQKWLVVWWNGYFKKKGKHLFKWKFTMPLRPIHEETEYIL